MAFTVMVQHLGKLAVQHTTQDEVLEYAGAVGVGGDGGVDHHFADFGFVGVVRGAYVNGCCDVLEEGGAV